MINEEKVKIMTKIAMYEQGKGRRYLPVSKYYRSDYIGLALIKNFFLVTIGYALAIAAVAVDFGEYLMDRFSCSARSFSVSFSSRSHRKQVGR